MRALLFAGALALVLLLFATRSKAAPVNITSNAAGSKIRQRYGDLTAKAARLFGIPQERLLAMIAVESLGNPQAVGSAGEQGLMQMLLPAYLDAVAWISQRGGWLKYGIPAYSYSQLQDAEAAIMLGAIYLRVLKDRSGDLDTATRGYNVGLSKALKDPNAGAQYLQKVLSWESFQFS